MIDNSQITQSRTSNVQSVIISNECKDLGSVIEYSYNLQKQILKKLSEKQRESQITEVKAKLTVEIMQKIHVLKKQFGVFQGQCQNQWPLMYKQLLEIMNSIATLYQIKINKLQEKLNEFQLKNKQYEQELRITKRLLGLNQSTKEKTIKTVTNQSNQLSQMKKISKVRISQYISENKESEKMKKMSQIVTVVNSPKREPAKLYRSSVFAQKESLVSQNSDLQTIKNMEGLQKKEFDVLLNEMNYNSVTTVLVYPKESCQNTLRKNDLKNIERQFINLNQTENIKPNFMSKEKLKSQSKKSISKISTNMSGRKNSLYQQNWNNSKFEDLRRDILSRRRCDRLF